MNIIPSLPTLPASVQPKIWAHKVIEVGAHTDKEYRIGRGIWLLAVDQWGGITDLNGLYYYCNSEPYAAMLYPLVPVNAPSINITVSKYNLGTSLEGWASIRIVNNDAAIFYMYVYELQS